MYKNKNIKVLSMLLCLLIIISTAYTMSSAQGSTSDPFEGDKWDAPSVVTTPTDIPEESSSSETTPSSSETTVPSSEPSSSETTPSSSETTVPSSEPSSSETTVPSTEPTENTTQPTASTTQPTASTTEPTKNTTSALDPSNPDNEPIPDDTDPTKKLTITVKNASGTVLGKINKFFVGNLKNGKKEYVFNYTLSDANAKVVWESTNTSKLQVVSNDGKQVKIKIVCKNPVKDFTDYVAVNCKYEGEVIFTLNLTYIQLDKVSNLKVIGKKLTWSEVPYASGYIVYDLTAKKEKVVTKTSFKTKPGHQYQVQAYEYVEAFKANNYSKKSIKVWSLETPDVKLTAGKKLIKIKYDQVKNANKFQVRYKSGKGKWTTKTFKAKKDLTRKIKKLKKGKTYSVQVRACKNNRSFSKWTKVKKIKVR